LSEWLTHERHIAMSLRKDQLELLESIDHKTVPLHRDWDDIKWEVKCNQLKQVCDKAGFDKTKFKDNSLSCWFWKQKNLLRRGKLEPFREHGTNRAAAPCASSVKLFHPQSCISLSCHHCVM
jgi:hypothetical protein